MERSDLVVRLTKIFHRIFSDDSITLLDELTANDVNNWDSLTHMILISEIEQDFKIKFRLKELNKMKNVGVLIEIISSKLS